MDGSGGGFVAGHHGHHHHHHIHTPAHSSAPRRTKPSAAAAPASGPVRSTPMAATTSSSTHAPAPQRSTKEDDVQWSLKDIFWQGRECKIITQNKNGPCSLIALCNILLLRGEVTITPPDRPVVSYEYLSQLIAEHLLTKAVGGEGLEEALSTLPRTQYGLDVDVGFDSISSFAASSGDGGKGELALFRLCGVPLVHGWLPDPADVGTYQAVQAAGSYNRATDVVVRGDEIAEGAVVRDRGVGTLAASLANESSVSNGKQPARNDWTEEERATIRHALALQSFLDTDSTQLTYHGLFVLAQELPSGQLVALFRNSHLSVLYKRLPHEGTDAADGGVIAPPPTLFTLATDSSFLLEDEIVWESLVDVDGASSEFYDGKFRRSTLRQRDYVGRDADGLGRDSGGTGFQQNEDADYALAMQLYQNDQDRLQREQQRRGGRQSQGGAHRSQHQQQPQQLQQAHPAAFQTPNEVFTTMRYEVEPRQEEADALVASTLVPSQLRDEHRDLLAGLQGLSVGEAGLSAPNATAPPAVPSTNPFLNAGESTAAAAPTSTSTNPFLNNAVLSAAAPGSASSGAADATTSHRLYRHIPLLAQHLERLRTSAGAICRAYSAVWSLPVLEQERSLEPDRILAAIESSLSSSTDGSGAGQVKGIRVAISKNGSIRVTQRSISPFPSTLQDGLGSARLPSVRFDAAPTRVRTMDLEPLVFNKTDARGFYEAAKQRVGADPSVLSGVRESDQRCFDVILWNDEQTDTLDDSSAATAPARLVTESSLANVVVEYTETDGGRSRFVTPRTSTGMLDGLLRRWLVDKNVVEEEDVNVDHLVRRVQEGSAQLWLCNSLRGLWKVELVDAARFAAAPPPGVAANASAAGKPKKNRFSQLIKGPTRSNSGTSAPAPAPIATSNNASPAVEQQRTEAVHDQVIDDLYGLRHGDKLKGKKGKKNKDDKKDCIIM